jgi:hypothetical protein
VHILSLAIGSRWHIGRPLALLQHLLHAGPAQQADSGRDEEQDDNLVLAAVALEARGEDVLVLGVAADGQVVRQAKGLVAGRARGTAGARAALYQRGLRIARQRRGFAAEASVRQRRRRARGRGVRVRAELDDGAVGEAGTFAETGRSLDVSVKHSKWQASQGNSQAATRRRKSELPRSWRPMRMVRDDQAGATNANSASGPPGKQRSNETLCWAKTTLLGDDLFR